MREEGSLSHAVGVEGRVFSTCLVYAYTVAVRGGLAGDQSDICPSPGVVFTRGLVGLARGGRVYA